MPRNVYQWGDEMKKQWFHVIVSPHGNEDKVCVFKQDEISEYNDKQFLCHCGTVLNLEDIEYTGDEPEDNPFSDDIYPARLLQ